MLSAQGLYWIRTNNRYDRSVGENYVYVYALPFTQMRIRNYPTKICPTCGTQFKSQSKYCSRSCGNARTFTPTQKAKLSNDLKQKFIDDPEYKQNTVANLKPDIPIPPQIEPPLGLDQFISDGDLWTEV